MGKYSEFLGSSASVLGVWVGRTVIFQILNGNIFQRPELYIRDQFIPLLRQTSDID